MVFNGKAYTCLALLVIAVATPKEGVSAFNLGELALRVCDYSFQSSHTCCFAPLPSPQDLRDVEDGN